MPEKKKLYLVKGNDYEDVWVEHALLGPAEADIVALKKEYEDNYASFELWLEKHQGFERVEEYNEQGA